MNKSTEVFEIEFKGSRFSRKKRYLLTAGAVAGAVAVLGLTGLVAWLIVRNKSAAGVLPIWQPIPIAQSSRISCFPEEASGKPADEEACERRGCTYEPSNFPAVPWCFFPQDGSYGYRVVSGPHDTDLGQRWLLRRKRADGVYGTNVENVTFDVEYLGNDMLRFKQVTSTTPHRTAPHRTPHPAPHRTAPPRTAPHRTTPHRTAPHRTAPPRTAPHRTTPHRTTPHHPAPHRTTPHRTAPPRTAPHRTSPTTQRYDLRMSQKHRFGELANGKRALGQQKKRYARTGDNRKSGWYKTVLRSARQNPFSLGSDPSPRTQQTTETYAPQLSRFDDADDENRFKVPLDVNVAGVKARRPVYVVEVYSDDPFSFRIQRRSSAAVLWDTGVGGLTFSDQFLQIATLLPSADVYGLGENTHLGFRHETNFSSWPMFARHQAPSSGKNHEHYNTYGVHPFYECVEADGTAHGVFLLNSNAMDYTLSPAPMMVYRTIGGILEFYMFLGPTPENVIQQYTQLIGRPFMPPYWSLGFHLSSRGWKNISDMETAVNRTLKYDIPLDVVHADVDYMDRKRPFTIDPTNFHRLPGYLNDLHAAGMKLVIVLEPPFEVNDTYVPYTTGLAMDMFVKWSNNSDDQSVQSEDSEDKHNVIGRVWPTKDVVFPDFFNNEAVAWWGFLVANFSHSLHFDGLRLDMNEPTNFLSNCSASKWDDPPYGTKAAFVYNDESNRVHGRLSDKTLCLATVHDGGQLRHYDVHSLYGWKQTKTTYEPMRGAVRNKRRGIIISQSTYAGSGLYAGHGLGDNSASWTDMRLSIVGMLEFSLFGIPFVGADICGFSGDCPAKLCRRWHQLGAFYPFARNNNGELELPQDPAYYGDDVALAAKEAMLVRYRLLPYLYTLFHRAHTRGSTVVRPLLHEFPRDKTARNIDTQFMWGAALLISPILTEDATNLKVYLPGGRWYDYYAGAVVSATGPDYVDVPVDDETPTQLHLRGGYIVPLQEPGVNTAHSRNNNFGLKVALDDVDGQAEGEVFWDDGQSTDTYENGEYYFAYFHAEENKLHMLVQHGSDKTYMNWLLLDTVDVMGVSRANYVYVNDVIFANFTFDDSSQILRLQNLNLSMTADCNIEWRSSLRPTRDEASRVECCPEGCNKDSCLVKGCLWAEPRDTAGVPACYINTQVHGYEFSGIGRLKWKNESSMFGVDVNDIGMLTEVYDHVYRFKIFDPNNDRYEVPVALSLSPSKKTEFSENIKLDSFTFSLSRSDDEKGSMLWNTSIGAVTFSDKFLQLTAGVSSANIYGFGEHGRTRFKHGLQYEVWPMFSTHQNAATDADRPGVHPFYLCVEENGRAHGVLLLNSNAMEVLLQPAPAVTYRTTGGVLDFYVIIGDSPEEVIQRYTEMIGLPAMPPYWALGYHVSRDGVEDIEQLQKLVAKTMESDIPLDTLHLHRDTHDENTDFTWDEDRFPDFPDYIKELQNQHVNILVDLDPQLVSNDRHYRPFHIGVNMDVYVKWPAGHNPDPEFNPDNILYGWAWSKGKVAFVDFFKENATLFWESMIAEYHESFPFDGVSLEMNTPANFGTNKDRAVTWPEDDKPYWTLKCPRNLWDDPPYTPRSLSGGRLSEGTICMVSVQQDSLRRHYDVHSVYGLKQAAPSLWAVRRSTNRRGLLLSRSTYPGSGQYGGHVLGDSLPTWRHMKQSIIGVLEFSLFGIPLIGADICGTTGNVSGELCERWHQLGAFYPLARHHNAAGNTDRDPASFAATVTSSIRDVLSTRYRLLPYLYTLFYFSHTRGSTVARPLFHEYPLDSPALDADRQFLWGSALLISPVLDEGHTQVYAYVPRDRWFCYYTGEEVIQTGQVALFDAPRDHIALHVRGGYILPVQQPGNTTYQSRRNPFGLIIAPDESNSAKGNLFWDDGESLDTISKGRYCFLEFIYSKDSISMSFVKNGTSDLVGLFLDTIEIFGVHGRPSEVTCNCMATSLTYTYNPQTKVLVLGELGLPMDEEFAIKFTLSP
ncbi:Maltase-glucoamylase, intestinal [Lamellibrachia satsuma]|nr:Maltase-glucoamylase, intestinal [Lamellibrachia satsuma]